MNFSWKLLDSFITWIGISVWEMAKWRRVGLHIKRVQQLCLCHDRWRINNRIDPSSWSNTAKLLSILKRAVAQYAAMGGIILLLSLSHFFRSFPWSSRQGIQSPSTLYCILISFFFRVIQDGKWNLRQRCPPTFPLNKCPASDDRPSKQSKQSKQTRWTPPVRGFELEIHIVRQS